MKFCQRNSDLRDIEMREAAHIHKIIFFSQRGDYTKYFKGNLLYTENVI